MKVAVNGSARVAARAASSSRRSLLDAVDLVERQDQRRPCGPSEPGEDALRVLVDALGRIDHQHHDDRRRRAPPQAASTMARSSRRRGAKMPGVSMKTIWLAPSMAMPRSGMRVVCTLWLTIETLAPTSALTSVDLPALGAPMMAMKPQRVSPPARLGRPAQLICASSPHALARQQRGGGGLLGGALAGALAARGLAALDAHLGGEARRVVRARRSTST